LLSHRLVEQELVEEALSLGGERVTLAVPQRGEKRRLINRILATAREALGRRLAESASQRQLLDGVAAAFGIDGPLNRIEVYDNSHIQGTNAVGAMIVAGPEGLVKNAYRKFTIRGTPPAQPRSGTLGSPETSPGTALIRLAALGTPGASEMHPLANAHTCAPRGRLAGEEGPSTEGSVGEENSGGEVIAGGDDYAMMREVLRRRFARALKDDPERDRGTWPDLILIDGGQGQLNVAQGVFEELGVADIAVAGIAKGPDRNAGRERFFFPGRAPFSLDSRDPVLYFLQRLRDEAHRFAIGTHRAKRVKALGHSPLDEIAGVGARRKQALLHHFGSARAVARAGLSELERVAGISKTVAKKIYDHFHPDG
jgi:excinuclease ABC subunit C